MSQRNIMIFQQPTTFWAANTIDLWISTEYREIHVTASTDLRFDSCLWARFDHLMDRMERLKSGNTAVRQFLLPNLFEVLLCKTKVDVRQI